MEFIVRHPNYAGMPDAYGLGGRIQWEAPSNRKSGQFKDTHHKRRQWWAQKASELGISTREDRWISRVAKRIHPTGIKPCKKCGREAQIRYAYPSKSLCARFQRLLPDIEPGDLEPITDLIQRCHEIGGDEFLRALPSLLSTESPPGRGTLDDWLDWLDRVFIPSEPALLSPGAMSNAPDRLDGFHSFNRCCRARADRGRTKTNLTTYVTDRRVFEYWAGGDWVAADRMMGILRRDFGAEECRHGHPGPCHVDHIGPISLGFAHRPKFQLLCGACNSAKNNRMYLSDVQLLLSDERDGAQVISWHSRALWDNLKHRVGSDEEARRLSKILRDNRHALMFALREVANSGYFTFLVTLLELERADLDVEFENLRIKNHLTHFDNIHHTARTTKYAVEQKARRCRIAFAALQDYFEKDNRSAFVLTSEASKSHLRKTIRALDEENARYRTSDQDIARATRLKPGEADVAFRLVLQGLELSEEAAFMRARTHFEAYMAEIATLLAEMWENERYVREIGISDEA